jgi:hypothetical protein
MRTTLLRNLHEKTKEKQVALLSVNNQTVAVDGATSRRKASVYITNAITPVERKVHLLGFEDVSEHVHDTEFTAGKLRPLPAATLPNYIKYRMHFRV